MATECQHALLLHEDLLHKQVVFSEPLLHGFDACPHLGLQLLLLCRIQHPAQVTQTAVR